jgi:hypothetical protein
MGDYNTLPGCVGYYGTPTEPNSCDACALKEVCRKVAEEFLPKAKLEPIIKRLESIIIAMEARA